MLADAVGDFVRREIRPVEENAAGRCARDPARRLEPLQAKAREAGLWCLEAPQEYGGGGLSAFSRWSSPSRRPSTASASRCPGARRVRLQPAGRALPRQPRADRALRDADDRARAGPRSPRSASRPAAPTRPARSAPPPCATATCYGINGRKMWTTERRSRAVWHRLRAHRPDRRPRRHQRTDRRRRHPGHDRHPRGGAARSLDQRSSLRRLRGARGESDRRGGPGFRPGPGVAGARAAPVRGAGHRRRRRGSAIASEWATQRETFGALLATRQAVQFAIADARDGDQRRAAPDLGRGLGRTTKASDARTRRRSRSSTAPRRASASSTR